MDIDGGCGGWRRICDVGCWVGYGWSVERGEGVVWIGGMNGDCCVRRVFGIEKDGWCERFGMEEVGCVGERIEKGWGRMLNECM